MCDQQYQPTIWVSDKVLAAILMTKGLRAVGSFQNPPSYIINFLFSDGRKIRRIISQYQACPTKYKHMDYGDYLDEIIFIELDSKQYIKHTAGLFDECK